MLGILEGLAPFVQADGEADYYKLAFHYDESWFDGLPRETFAAAVRAEGVALWAGFRTLHRTHSGRRFRAAGDLPNADRIDTQLLVLHHPVLVGGETAIAQVVDALRKVSRFAREIRDTVPRPAYHSPATSPPDT